MRRTERWRLLRLTPPFAPDEPASMRTVDLMAFALRSANETEDPIIGFVQSAADDLHALAFLLNGADGWQLVANTLTTIARRVEVSAILLRRCDRDGDAPPSPRPVADDGPETQETPRT